MSNGNAADALEKKRVNRFILERLMGATRQKMGPFWMLRLGNHAWPMPEKQSATCTRNEDDWTVGYQGPDFHEDRNWMAQAEQSLLRHGLAGQYARELVRAVYPDWDTLDSEADVLAFWFAIATAPPAMRAPLAAKVAEAMLP